MREQILALLEEVKGKLIIELQKKENFESEKQQLLQQIESLNAQIIELHVQIAQFETQDAEILARAQEMNDMLDGSMPPPPPIKLTMNVGTPKQIAQDIVLYLTGEVVTVSNYSNDTHTITVDETEYILSSNESVEIGIIEELINSILTVRNHFSNNTLTYQLVV